MHFFRKRHSCNLTAQRIPSGVGRLNCGVNLEWGVGGLSAGSGRRAVLENHLPVRIQNRVKNFSFFVRKVSGTRRRSVYPCVIFSRIGIAVFRPIAADQ